MTHNNRVEVTLAPEGTPLAQFQKERTDAISEMFDNKYEDGIYPTSHFFSRLDRCVEDLLKVTEQRVKEEMRQSSDASWGKCEDCQNWKAPVYCVPCRNRFRDNAVSEVKRELVEEMRLKEEGEHGVHRWSAPRDREEWNRRVKIHNKAIDDILSLLARK
jgi:hypothetical protein